MNKPNLLRLTPVALALLALSAQASSAPELTPQPTLSEHIATVIEAQPVKRVDPKYPVSSARKGQEGWVAVSFVINEDGGVEDPVVQDSSGLKAFEKATLQAVKRWQYSPAIQDGKPIQQCRNMVRMDFRLQGKLGVTRKFLRQYREVTDAINAKDLALAAEKLTEMKDDQLWNHIESAYFWLADSYYAKAIQDDARELKSVRRATIIENESIKKSTRQYLLQRRFVLAVNLSEYRDALETYNKLVELAGDDQSQLAQLSLYADQVRELMTSTEPMIRKASIDDEGRVFHELSRNAFELNIAQGDLHEVQIRCDNKLSRFTAVSQSQWHIPSTWGHCSVFVSGTPGAEFEVIELGEYVGEI
ncbi:energy transducer TonB [Alteromonas lipolytica]|uniref:TonB C-terminal domain-containing protein n=1 Tax=Alteromonas lipolytica TaxID=1856405 RepID=A0A1E8FGI8_9ALTE|nr:energy transducer TonB [Alteromonas lipolytica]OFI34856.1 hypothetical protein BFC17_14880 [Alteromonas lipolytica]GGF54552.1 hypothetical protein GCM10011338_03440 [Alteromonas lipolytica]